MCGAAIVGGALVGQVLTDSRGVAGPQTRVGGGTISSYIVSDVRYAIEGDRLSAVSFALDGVPRRVRVRVASSGPWHDCGASGHDNLVICAGLDERVAEADELSVVASS